MSDVHACMIVPASLAPLARALAGGLSDRGVGMFEVGLSATGNEPATHFISVGMIDAQIRNLLKDSAALFSACNAAGAPVTLAQCQALVTQSDVSGDDPWVAMARRGLQLVRVPL